MTSKELKKYIGKYVSFDVDSNAFELAPWLDGNTEVDRGNHFEGILVFEEGGPFCISHFGIKVYDEIEKEYVCIGVLDRCIPYIENFKVKENEYE